MVIALPYLYLGWGYGYNSILIKLVNSLHANI